jgi:hypothetical protein
MADAMEALRKHVNEEASDELVGVERHGGVSRPTLDAVALDLEGHAAGIGLYETAFRDGDAMGVAGQICARAPAITSVSQLGTRPLLVKPDMTSGTGNGCSGTERPAPARATGTAACNRRTLQ